MNITTKVQAAYNKSVDWVYAQWFRLWRWQTGPLGIYAWISDEGIEQINGALEIIQEENALLYGLADKVEGLEQTNAHLLRRNQELIQQLSTSDGAYRGLLEQTEDLQWRLDQVSHVFGETFAHGTTGETRPNRPKLTEREVQEIRNMKRQGVSQAELATMYDVNPATISRIVRGQYYSKAAA